MITIVCIHGVGNHRAGHPPSTVAAHLATEWCAALTRGPLGNLPDHTTLTAAYYSHRLRRPGVQASAEQMDRLPYQTRIMIGQWLDTVSAKPGIAQGRLTRNLRQDITRLAQRRGLSSAAVQRFVVACFGEVSRYLDPASPQRGLARTEVATAIAAANRETTTTIVIAHSLGSVVTYETLHAYPHLTADLLVTIGSPLALPHAVYQRLDPAPQPPGQRPPGVTRWINIADTGDLIAIPPRAIREHFDGIDDDIQTSIHWADFHTAANYLRTQALADTLRPYLTKPAT